MIERELTTIGDSADARRRTVVMLSLTVAVLTAALLVRAAFVEGDDGFWFNLGLAAVVGALAWAASMTATELGLQRRFIGSGLRWGSVAFAAISAVLIVAAAVPASSGFFDDDRVGIGISRMWLRVLVVIPLGTVLVEELAFRGVILGLLRRLMSTKAAVAIAAGLFGLWHVPTAWNAAADSSTSARLAAVVGTVAATTGAGIAFGWLRLVSHSLVAPAMAHIATNSVAFAIAWTVA